MKSLFACSVPGALFVAAALLVGIGGCGSNRSRGPAEGEAQVNLGTTIGSVAQVVTPTNTAVEGFGLVGNLAGTGSATCPPQVRAYLKQYILAQLPDDSINADNLINSDTTAVVRIEGAMPPLASAGDHFDVRATLIPGSETTSLQGGWLYNAELYPQGFGGMAGRVLARVEGPTFVDMTDVAEIDPTTAYVLGRGRVEDSYMAIISLPESSYALASAIRDRLSEQYGPSVVKRAAPDSIQYVVPSRFAGRKLEFVAMVAATFLEDSPELFQRRVDYYIAKLASGEDVQSSEIALEAIGRRAVDYLTPLLDVAEADVRFSAARVMLNLGDDRALPVLREAAMNPASAHRLEAIKTVADSARRSEAVTLLRILLRDSDMRVVLAAYERLRDMGDTSISQDFVGRSFYLERVARAEQKAVFAARQGDPRIVIFGGPLTCSDDVFVQSPAGDVVISARPGQGYMSLARQDPARGGLIGPLRTGYLLTEVIRALGAETNLTGEGQVSGLEVSYGEILALLQRMCASGAVDAEFWPGPLAEFE